jgi:DNA polymerase
MIIGEAPGEKEDLQGIPFCGKSGNLLDKMLLSIGIDRGKNAYITNILFWRPPGNRKPTPQEIAICRPIVEKHIAIFKPKVIILCGSTAVESVLQQTGITKLVGKMEEYTNRYINYDLQGAVTTDSKSSGIAVFPMFHPSYLLRDPLKRREAWFALLKILEYCTANGIL